MSDKERLQILINEISTLIEKRVTNKSEEFITWKTKVELFLSKKYGEDSKQENAFKKVSFSLFAVKGKTTNADYVDACRNGLKKTRAILTAYLDDCSDETASIACEGDIVETDFHEIIKADCNRCKELLKSDISQSNTKLYQDLFNELYGKYSKSSSNFPKLDTNPLLLQNHMQMYRDNLIKIHGFLQGYILNGCTDYGMPSETDRGIVINNYNEQNNIINISFSEVKREIENMSGLKEEDIEEINSKIDALEEIIKSGDRKSKKWSNAKEIVKWMADKSVDVALTLIPLLLQIK